MTGSLPNGGRKLISLLQNKAQALKHAAQLWYGQATPVQKRFTGWIALPIHRGNIIQGCRAIARERYRDSYADRRQSRTAEAVASRVGYSSHCRRVLPKERSMKLLPSNKTGVGSQWSAMGSTMRQPWRWRRRFFQDQHDVAMKSAEITLCVRTFVWSRTRWLQKRPVRENSSEPVLGLRI